MVSCASSADPVMLVIAMVTVSMLAMLSMAHEVNFSPSTPTATPVAVSAVPIEFAAPASPDSAFAAAVVSVLTLKLPVMPARASVTALLTSELEIEA